MLVRFACMAAVCTSGALAQSSFRSLPPAALGGLRSAQPGEASWAVSPPDVQSLPDAVFGSGAQDLPRVDLELLADGDFGGEFERGGSSLETRRGGWSARITDTDDERTVSAEIGIEGSFYQFSGAPPLGSVTTDPLNDVYRTWVGGSYAAEPRPGSFGAFAGFEASFGGEDEVGTGESLSVGALGGWRYRAAEELTLSAGLAGVTRLEDDARIWPFLGFDWAISDSLSLEILGPEIEFAYRWDDSWRSYLGASYEMRQYRLNNDGPTAGGVLRDEAIRLGAGLEYSPSSAVRLSVEGGLSYWRELTLLEDEGGSSSEVEVEPSPYLGVQLAFGF